MSLPVPECASTITFTQREGRKPGPSSAEARGGFQKRLNGSSRTDAGSEPGRGAGIAADTPRHADCARVQISYEVDTGRSIVHPRINSYKIFDSGIASLHTFLRCVNCRQREFAIDNGSWIRAAGKSPLVRVCFALRSLLPMPRTAWRDGFPTSKNSRR